MARELTPPETCPDCGEDVPRGARACPGCGADERSGWKEDDARYDGLDLPDDAFDDEDSDGGSAKISARKLGRRGTTGWVWILAAGVLLVLFILSAFIR